MNAAKSAQTDRDTAGEAAKLDRCYGKIGISAVAAAVHCCQAEPRRDERRSIVPQETD
ncbi:MAG TPA: hypothetical protein VFB45_09935 [Pseudolabrys sp.]|nr:hypothetical protein [Pseudolabrys sp.]